MATGHMSIVEHFRSAVLLRDGAGMTDGHLLEDYISRRDETAFAALVQRHGPMVWGVCRQILGNHHRAEDAFQATFLVLVRRAASIASPEMLANWLYGVAHKTAFKARAITLKRKVREKQVRDVPEPAAVEQDYCDDLGPVLDQELCRLPDFYRVVIVLCDLEGNTRKEAARQLGLPEGTVGSRLARARAVLAKRLTSRGITLSGGGLAAVLAQNVVSAGVPDSLASSTIEAASLFAAGQTAAGIISPTAAALTERVLNGMFMCKLKVVTAVVMVMGLLATAATGLTMCTTMGQNDKPPAAVAPGFQLPAAEEKLKSSPKNPEDEKEAFTAWGKEVGGLQAGLGFKPGENRAYHTGETVTLVARIRNVSKNKVQFYYHVEFLNENTPAVTDAKGNAVPLKGQDIAGGPQGVGQVDFEPGKEIELYELNLDLRPASEAAKRMFRTLYGTGTFHIQYNRLDRDRFGAEEHYLDESKLSKLATGKLELEVRADAPAPKPKSDQNRDAVEMLDRAAIQGSWTLESVDGKRVENGRTIKFDNDTVTGLFLDEEKTPRIAKFRLLAERTVTGMDVGPQLAPKKDDWFKMRGIYELESDTLKLAFLPKLDARNPPPGLDRERRPKSFDQKLVQIWVFRREAK